LIIENLPENMENLKFKLALEQIWNLIGEANRYIDEASPWALAREKRGSELGRVVYNLAECLRIIAILLSPFIPESAEKIWSQLGIEESLASQKFPQSCAWGRLKPGNRVRPGPALFPRIET